MGDSQDIEDLAQAVSDGLPIDWSTASSEGGRLATQLRVVAAVADAHRAAALATEAVPSPLVWGHLRVGERIGGGAFGEVFRAWDSRLDREVALKLAPVPRADDQSSGVSFIGEGRLLAKVTHPNVVTIYGAEQIGDRIGLWMELVHGRTLEDELQPEGRFPAERVVQVGRDLARAVAAVHAAGLLHRDIKTQNVMRDTNGRLVLMDFGAGRELVADQEAAAGTPLYLAPEILAGHPASIQSDIYSVGVVLFHLVTGSYPVLGNSARELKRAHESGERQTLRALAPHTPRTLARVLERALDPRPERRYESADALARDLDRMSDKSRRRLLLYGAAVSVVAVSAALWAWSPGSRESDDVLSPGERPRIAVLPLQPTGGDQELVLIADGLVREVRRQLVAIEGLTVRASGTQSASAAAGGSITAVGRELGVNLVLTVAVVRSDRTDVLTVELVRARDQRMVWGDTFPLASGGTVATHEEIALAVVNRLRLRIGKGQRRYELDPDLYYDYLKAQGLMARRHVDNAGRAADLFEQIIRRQPSHAPSWAGLANALAAFGRATPGESLPPPNPRMEEAARAAMRIDPLLAETQAALGNLYARDRKWQDAEDAFRESLRIDPSLTTTYTDFVLAVMQPMGRIQDSLVLLQQAMDVDPQSLDVHRILALAQVDAGLYEDAIRNARWVLERDPAFPYAELWLGRALAFSGRVAAAKVIFESNPGWFGYLGHLLAVSGQQAEAKALADAHPESPSRQMLIYAGLGDTDRAIDALEKAIDSNWWRAAAWMHRPEMAVVRDHPRVQAIKLRLGLTK